MNTKTIHFEGDEDWKFNEEKHKDLFHGWFDNKTGTLLEAGCGVGNYIIIFSKRGFNVTGVEISKERIEIAKDNCKKYNIDSKIIEGDIRKLELDDNSFDFIFSHGVVEHFLDTQKALDEFYRVLKKDGEAMISVPNKYTSYTLSKKMQLALDKLFKTRLWKGGYERSFSIKTFKDMLERTGFKIIDERSMECTPGKKYPIVGKVLRTIDKPLYWSGVGGHFLHFYCKKL